LGRRTIVVTGFGGSIKTVYIRLGYVNQYQIAMINVAGRYVRQVEQINVA
jgi:hypothetical protein